MTSDSDPEAGVAPELFKSVLRQHAKGVAVITAGTGQPVALCVTSLTSVSLVPPVVLFAIRLSSWCWPVLRDAPYVMAHLLAADQEDLARRFGQPGADRFGPATRWHRGPFGLPTLDHVLAWMVLAPLHRLTVGDHAVVLSQVVRAKHDTPGPPLVHHNRGFAHLIQPTVPSAMGA